jgi:hypothetical protein
VAVHDSSGFDDGVSRSTRDLRAHAFTVGISQSRHYRQASIILKESGTDTLRRYLSLTISRFWSLFVLRRLTAFGTIWPGDQYI